MAHMEDVLDLYAEPYNPERPVVCFDETSTQMLAHARPPIPAAPGHPRREDYEYRREGTRNLFLACEPLAGWRHVEVTQRRTKEDFAHQMRWLVDEAYPDVAVVRVVLDNLNTHRKASLYEAFPADEARRIAKRLEFHHTPKHGSWLNMAEIEFSVFSRSCLRQRLPDEESLCREVRALELERNEAQARINWRFSIQDARTKLHRLYPIVHSIECGEMDQWETLWVFSSMRDSHTFDAFFKAERLAEELQVLTIPVLYRASSIPAGRCRSFSPRGSTGNLQPWVATGRGGDQDRRGISQGGVRPERLQERPEGPRAN